MIHPPLVFPGLRLRHGTVVENPPHHLKVKGSSLAVSTRNKKMAKSVNFIPKMFYKIGHLFRVFHSISALLQVRVDLIQFVSSKFDRSFVS